MPAVMKRIMTITPLDDFRTESHTGFYADFSEQHRGRTKAGDRRLDQIDVDKGFEPDEAGMDETAESQRDQNHGAGKCENGTIDGHRKSQYLYYSYIRFYVYIISPMSMANQTTTVVGDAGR